MKKLLKILGITGGVMAIVLIIGLLLVLKMLPSAQQVGQYLRPSVSKTALKQAKDTSKASASPIPTTEGSTESETSAPGPATSMDSTLATSEKEDELLLNDLLDDQKPLADVCDNLKSAAKIRFEGYSLTQFGQNFKDSVLTDSKDPAIQAIKPSLKYIFNQPNMRELLRGAIDAAATGEEDSLSNKARFYATAVAAYGELVSNKTQIEHVMDRSYHLMILSKVIAKKPQLLDDAATNHFCRDIEASLNRSEESSFAEERAEFDRFIKDSGVAPQDVGYDPGYKTQLKIEMHEGNLAMKGGWIDSLLKPTNEELGAVQAEAQKKK